MLAIGPSHLHEKKDDSYLSHSTTQLNRNGDKMIANRLTSCALFSIPGCQITNASSNISIQFYLEASYLHQENGASVSELTGIPL